MGWFDWAGSSTSNSPSPQPSTDGGYIAPDRSARSQCWEARDSFFACLDKNGIIDSVKEEEKANKACPAELKEFERNCASSWVTYFKKRRVFEYQKEQTLRRMEAEGAQGLERSNAGGAAAAALKGR